MSLFDSADAVFVNLECVIAASGRPGPDRAFHFRAPPSAVETLGWRVWTWRRLRTTTRWISGAKR